MNPFFFLAEDGIRDAQEARGLGDGYKRQRPGPDEVDTVIGTRTGLYLAVLLATLLLGMAEVPVSYTHLTLPTNYSV